eukprot:TRINITY_DN736_c1_g2_i1.p1 TRINITY_DN736_c1_g2~~TRINITY_DN736_c1_g2_i1.p1  ORF type:complete len:229 (+),score=29.72 TRINITY_DN736_c1_g2_i1:60-746(+)
MFRSLLLASSVAGVLGNLPEVWRQFPLEDPGLPGIPPFQPPDVEVAGIPVNGRDGGVDFALLGGPEPAYIEEIPSFLRQATYHAVPSVAEDGGLRFECPLSQPCTFFVIAFHCVPCSIGLGGGLTQNLLLSDGWEARRCAPVMMFGSDPSSYPMMAFRVEVAPMSSVETPRFTSTGIYIGVFATVGSTPFCEIPRRPHGPHQVSLTRCSSSTCPMKPKENGPPVIGVR